MAIKPSKLRWEKWPVMAEANRMVKEYTAERPRLGYADLATPLLDGQGKPKDVFMEDGLHLDKEGYRLWQEALAPFLDAISLNELAAVPLPNATRQGPGS